MRARGDYVRTYRGPLNGLLVMLRTDGLMALQAGLAPAMLYQFVMNGLRLGSYAMLEAGGWVKVQELGCAEGIKMKREKMLNFF